MLKEMDSFCRMMYIKQYSSMLRVSRVTKAVEEPGNITVLCVHVLICWVVPLTLLVFVLGCSLNFRTWIQILKEPVGDIL